MTNRATATEVKVIIKTDLADSIVTTFINMANRTVTDYLGTNTDISTAQKKDIETWLAAHFIASTREQQAQAEQAGDARITYQGKTEMGLDSTFYGQTVKMLDTTGTLAAQIGKKGVTVTAVTSKERSEWTPNT